MKAVNAGEVEGADRIYHYYYFGDQAKTGENSKNVALHYSGNEDPGAFVSISGGGVLASSERRRREAQLLLAYITSRGGTRTTTLADNDTLGTPIGVSITRRTEHAETIDKLDAALELNTSTLNSPKRTMKLIQEKGLF